jgi:hypothetical protein
MNGGSHFGRPGGSLHPNRRTLFVLIISFMNAGTSTTDSCAQYGPV